MRREPSTMRLDAGFDLNEVIPVIEDEARTTVRSFDRHTTPARHASNHRVIDANPRPDAIPHAKFGWIGNSLLAPPRQPDPDANRKLRGGRSHVAYDVARQVSDVFQSKELRYILDDADFDFCRRSAVPLPVASRLIALLEHAYAKRLLTLSASETAFGRLFSEPMDMVTSPKITSPVKPGIDLKARQIRAQTCGTCTAPFDATSSDRPLSCSGCGATAHKSCWCLPRANVDARWLCERCASGPVQTPQPAAAPCHLCGGEVCPGMPQLHLSVKAISRYNTRSAAKQKQNTVTSDATAVPSEWVHLQCAWIVDAAVIDAMRRKVIVEAPSATMGSCTRCGHSAPENYLVKCCFSDCARVFHAACVPVVEARRDPPASADAIVDPTFTTFCTEHGAIRDLHNSEYAASGRLEDLSMDAEHGAEALVAEDSCDQDDGIGLLNTVAKHWKLRRSERRAWGEGFIRGLDQENRALVEAVAHPEIVRHSETGTVRRSAVLSLVPELQVYLSRKLEPHLWVTNVFTEQSLCRYGLEQGIHVDRDQTPALDGRDRDTTATALLRLKRIATSAALATGIAENVRLRERTKQRLVALEVALIRTRFGLDDKPYATSSAQAIGRLIAEQAEQHRSANPPRKR